ncbi:hypothetical protein F652_536 [Enterobacteriaceae bacterium bta3-1]|nr:hypothetical protein F652_536 [Enterobacteriaceae bacterium bta3-1]
MSDFSDALWVIASLSFISRFHRRCGNKTDTHANQKTKHIFYI